MMNALTCGLSPVARVVGMILAVEPGPYTFGRLREAANLAPWELEQALRELGNPERRCLVSQDLERISLRLDVETPFTCLLSSGTLPLPIRKELKNAVAR